jgi:hypothetical protein
MNLYYGILYHINLLYIYNYINHCTFWEAHGPTDTAGHSGHTAGSCFKAVQSPPCRKVSSKDWDEVGYMLHPEVITWWGVFGVDKSSSLWDWNWSNLMEFPHVAPGGTACGIGVLSLICYGIIDSCSKPDMSSWKYCLVKETSIYRGFQ